MVGEEFKSVAERATIVEQGLTRFLTGVQLGLSVRSLFEVQVCRLNLVPEDDRRWGDRERGGHRADERGGSCRESRGALPRGDSEPHAARSFGCLGQRGVHVLWSDKAGDVVDVREGVMPHVDWRK